MVYESAHTGSANVSLVHHNTGALMQMSVIIAAQGSLE